MLGDFHHLALIDDAAGNLQADAYHDISIDNGAAAQADLFSVLKPELEEDHSAGKVIGIVNGTVLEHDSDVEGHAELLAGAFDQLVVVLGLAILAHNGFAMFVPLQGRALCHHDRPPLFALGVQIIQDTLGLINVLADRITRLPCGLGITLEFGQFIILFILHVVRIVFSFLFAGSQRHTDGEAYLIAVYDESNIIRNRETHGRQLNTHVHVELRECAAACTGVEALIASRVRTGHDAYVASVRDGLESGGINGVHADSVFSGFDGLVQGGDAPGVHLQVVELVDLFRRLSLGTDTQCHRVVGIEAAQIKVGLYRVIAACVVPTFILSGHRQHVAVEGVADKDRLRIMELIEQIAAVIRGPVLPQELGVGQEPVGFTAVICDFGGLEIACVFIPISIHIDICGFGCSAVAAQRNIHGLQGVGGRAEHELAVAGIGTRRMGDDRLLAVVIDNGLGSVLAAVNEAEALHLFAEGRKRRRIRDRGDKRGQDLCGILGFVPRRDREASRGHIVVEFQEVLHRLSVSTKDGEELSNVVLILVQDLHQHVIDFDSVLDHRRKNELVCIRQLAIDLAVAVVVDVVLNTADGQGHVALHGDIVGGVIGKGKLIHAEHAHADGDKGIACVRFTVKEDLIRVRQVEIDVLEVLDSPVGGHHGRRITKLVRRQVLRFGLERNRVISALHFGGLAHLIGKFNVRVIKECVHGLLDLLSVQIAVLGPGNGRGHIHIDLLHAVEDHVDRVVVTGTQITATGKSQSIGTHKLQSGALVIPHRTGVDYVARAVGEV